MTRLSIVVICYNEEAILGKCLSAVQWADEIVVVDSFSTDRTLEIARRYTDRVFQHPWQGYGKQKNLALGYASSPWVLSLDADEVVSPALAQEIQSLLAKGPECAGYRLPRMTWYLNRLLRHCWYPNYRLRLFLKEHAQWGEEELHEIVHLEGPVKNLQNPLIHYSFPTIRDHLHTIQEYTAFGVELLIRNKKTFSLSRLIGSPLVMFCKQYLLKRGFLDGLPGFIACVLSGVHEFVKYAKFYEWEQTHRKAIRSVKK